MESGAFPIYPLESSGQVLRLYRHITRAVRLTLPTGAPTPVAAATAASRAGPAAAPEASRRSPAERSPGLRAALAALGPFPRRASGLRRVGSRRPAAPSTCEATASDEQWRCGAARLSPPLPAGRSAHLPRLLSRRCPAPPRGSPASRGRPESGRGQVASGRTSRRLPPPPAAALAPPRAAMGPVAGQGLHPGPEPGEPRGRAEPGLPSWGSRRQHPVHLPGRWRWRLRHPRPRRPSVSSLGSFRSHRWLHAPQTLPDRRVGSQGSPGWHQGEMLRDQGLSPPPALGPGAPVPLAPLTPGQASWPCCPTRMYTGSPRRRKKTAERKMPCARDRWFWAPLPPAAP